MTTTTPASFPALVRRQWDREPDAFHPLVWAEWLEEKGHTDRGELVRLEFECRDPGCDCVACRRVRELRETLSAWPCPRCESETGSACGVCGNAGRLLPVNDAIVAWDCGCPRWVTLPTIEDAVRAEALTTDTRMRLRMEGIDPSPDYAPTPRLRALAAVPPWGVPLDGLRVGDREPMQYVVGLWVWYGTRATEISRDNAHHIPGAVWDRVDLPVDERTAGFCKAAPTEQAAQDALARGLVKFAREYTG